MLSIETRKSKAECWASPWRGIGETREGRPGCYVLLSVEEMFIAAKTGIIRIPDSQIPERARVQRDRRRVLENLGVGEELIREVVLS